MSKPPDLSKFTDAIRQLSQLSGSDLRTVMTAEAGKILETAIRFTPKASREKIEAQVTHDVKHKFARHSSDAGTYYKNKKDGKEWFSPGEWKEKWYLIHGWNVPDAVWAAYVQTIASDEKDFEATLHRRIKEALGRRGLTAATWAQIGEAIGAPALNVPNYIKNATIPDNIGLGRVTVSADGVLIEGANGSLVLDKTGKGQGIINRAINARVKYFETSVAKGAFNSLKNRARAYPELFKDAA